MEQDTRSYGNVLSGRGGKDLRIYVKCLLLQMCVGIVSTRSCLERVTQFESQLVKLLHVNIIGWSQGSQSGNEDLYASQEGHIKFDLVKVQVIGNKTAVFGFWEGIDNWSMRRLARQKVGGSECGF